MYNIRCHCIKSVKQPHMCCMPNASEKIASAVRNAENYGENNPEIIFVKNMEEAVDKALEKAVRGDKVSLCPACTAFDMYLNFEVRGNYYKEIVLGK